MKPKIVEFRVEPSALPQPNYVYTSWRVEGATAVTLGVRGLFRPVASQGTSVDWMDGSGFVTLHASSLEGSDAQSKYVRVDWKPGQVLDSPGQQPVNPSPTPGIRLPPDPEDYEGVPDGYWDSPANYMDPRISEWVSRRYRSGDRIARTPTDCDPEFRSDRDRCESNKEMLKRNALAAAITPRPSPPWGNWAWIRADGTGLAAINRLRIEAGIKPLSRAEGAALYQLLRQRWNQGLVGHIPDGLPEVIEDRFTRPYWLRR